jgi:glycerol-3-phosphate O-acyltransferase
VSAVDWVLAAVAAVLAGGLVLRSVRRTRAAITGWLNRSVVRAVHRFRVRIDRYKLVRKPVILEDLLQDEQVCVAMAAHARAHGLADAEVRRHVERYVDEIVPHFSVFSYYKLGYNLARGLINVLYRATSEYQDVAALNAIPRRDVVVYLMNHRSNTDYVVVAYVLAEGVSISYAVGEWARVWPLEYVFKSFGAYFVRRGFREPLYHTVLERYIQLITRNGVTQGIFLEGGLSRDGGFRAPKLGLLDYVARTLTDPRFDRDIWLVPVALNYDRVLEDRTLIRELVDPENHPGRLRQLSTVVAYLFLNAVRFLTGNLKRYGRVAVNFGTPVSLRGWLRERPGTLTLEKADRLARMQALAQEMMTHITEIMPVTPVPLVAAALLSFRQSVVRRADLLDRIEEYRSHLAEHGRKLVHPERDAEAVLQRAWRMFSMRRIVAREGLAYVIFPKQRPLLEYYANSIAHLLPHRHVDSGMHPALEPEDSLPTLRSKE